MTMVLFMNWLVAGLWLITGYSFYVFLTMSRSQARGWENSVCLSHRVSVGKDPEILGNVQRLTVYLCIASVVMTFILSMVHLATGTFS
ncbi:hypothetical protein PHABIO_407 [Pseudomonas phage Phabio]|uniref:Uncharacterized protein n=1 Tax=Pseudomonas phage Phabio TaxID=2006668 RepID=A0A1Y0T0L7_9CAUD|nr:hypothetical protein MZD05_gp407 [Pseudomonas phage Phabio]ARV77038.1 hypothetical protein PHABIO_407 [Pseudomonas phage Phabio]